MSEFKREVDKINVLLNDALQTVVPESKRSDAEFWISVIIKVLEEAAHQYEDAYAEGKITNILKYQDAQGLRIRANEIFEEIADSIGESSRRELRELFAGLKESMGNVEEPEKVSKLIDEIVLVIPEFPLGLLIVLGTLLSAVLITTRLRGYGLIKQQSPCYFI